MRGVWGADLSCAVCLPPASASFLPLVVVVGDVSEEALGASAPCLPRARSSAAVTCLPPRDVL